MARHGSARHGLVWLSCFRYEGFQERFVVKVGRGSVWSGWLWCGLVRFGMVFLTRGAVNEK